MSHHTPARQPKGTPEGGQFAASARNEPSVALTVAPSIENLPVWTPPAGTDDPQGSFSRCKEVSAEYTAFLIEQGVDAEWVQVCGPHGDFPEAQPEWKTVDQRHWQHYLTRVNTPAGPLYVDFTARQFDPLADHPAVTEEIESKWADVYEIRSAVIDKYLRAWRSG